MPPSAEPAAGGLAAIAKRHGLALADVVRLPAQGIANHVYALGERLVLRIARPAPELVADLRKEAVVIPAAVRVGVRTPALVDFDDSGDLVGTPYVVLERAAGTRPAIPERATGDPWAPVYREVGAQLALLHDGVVAGSLPDVPVDTGGADRPPIADLAAAGHLNPDLADWLDTWFDRLAGYLPPHPRRTLIHGDASPTNLLVDRGEVRLTALLDWGDAAWTDPSVDFAKLPLRAVPYALQGYLGDTDAMEAWAARVLWHHLGWAIARIPSPPDPTSPHWSAQPASRLLDVMRFFLEDPPEPWSRVR